MVTYALVTRNLHVYSILHFKIFVYGPGIGETDGQTDRGQLTEQMYA